MSAEIWNAIAVVKDPRVQGRIDYPLGLILLVSLYATISGCDDWEQIEDYANIHSEDLRNLYTKLSGKELKVSRMPTPLLARFLQLMPIIGRAFSALIPRSKYLLASLFTLLSSLFAFHLFPLRGLGGLFTLLEKALPKTVENKMKFDIREFM